MTMPFVKFHGVSFSYESAAEVLLQDVSLHMAAGWSGVVGANGSGKTTLLRLATGLLRPTGGQVEFPSFTVYCPQRTDDAPERLGELLRESSHSANRIKGRLGFQDDWLQRWRTLSHGERKRAQIGVALWQEPAVLAIDEPTNHVDAEARAVIADALSDFSGVGLLVSHDRELLDNMCRQCLFVDPPAVVVRPGGVTKGLKIAREEKESLQKARLLKRQAFKRLKREAHRRRRLADGADKRVSKGRISRKDHDAKSKIDAARITGKDAVGGKLLRQLDGRLEKARQDAESIRAKKE